MTGMGGVDMVTSAGKSRWSLRSEHHDHSDIRDTVFSYVMLPLLSRSLKTSRHSLGMVSFTMLIDLVRLRQED